MQYYFYFCFLLGAATALFCGVLTYRSSEKNSVSQTWLYLNIFSALWSSGYFLIIVSTSSAMAYYASILLHGAAFFIPCLFLHFILAFTGKVAKYKIPLYVGYGSAVLLVLFLVPTNLFVQEVVPRFVFNYTPLGGPLFFLFAVHFWWIIALSMYVLYREENYTKGITRTQLQYISLGGLLGFIGGGSTFLYSFNLNIAPFPIILFTAYPVVITYAIVRHNLFNVKIIVTELLVFTVWILILARMILASSLIDRIGTGVLMVGVILAGIYLISSILNESRQKDRIQELADQLANANERLRQLEVQKTEFVSIASHQLRTPLTVMKGYTSMLLEGSFGAVGEKAKEVLNKMFTSSQRLVTLVEDLLTVSKIEQGKVQYQFLPVDLEEIMREVIEGNRMEMEEKHLGLSFQKEHDHGYLVNADHVKLRQAINNVLNNSIAYTQKGLIRIFLSHDEGHDRVRLSISDTGMGMNADTIQKISNFSGADASKMDAEVTGIGLYILYQILKAHHGKFWVDSPGEGRGTTVFIELPAYKGEAPSTARGQAEPLPTQVKSGVFRHT